jgi:hypothetical protein
MTTRRTVVIPAASQPVALRVRLIGALPKDPELTPQPSEVLFRS